MIDLRELDFIDSTGLPAILDFALVSGPAPGQRAFDISGLTPQLRRIDP